MCSILGIAGEFDPRNIRETLEDMGRTLAHRGPDYHGTDLGEGYAFQHNLLAIIDPENGQQPMKAEYEGHTYTIVYNGELYNTDELRNRLIDEGMHFKTRCDTEVVLKAYIRWGRDCAKEFNGIFAFAVHDQKRREIFLSRDRFGVKPLFYTLHNGVFIFSSEIKAILKYPGFSPRMDREGFWQLIYLLPVREAGHTAFKDIAELPPAHSAVFGGEGPQIWPYWALRAMKTEEGDGEIVEHTRFLLTDAIRRQLVSDVPLCTLLSGGLDSSVITAVAADCYRERGMKLATFSFEYEGNREHFKASLFQPQSDDDYAAYLAEYLGTVHTVLTAKTEDIAALLVDAERYRDFPGMADIDSSLLLYCGRIAEGHKVAISGECSDEVFGGYPWFYRPEMLNRDFFPWIHDPFMRVRLFRPEIARPKEGFDYAKDVYRRSVEACPKLEGDTERMRVSRIASWLSIQYFMSSLLERKDRMSMGKSLEVRVPYADHRLVEYVFNAPWEIKNRNGVEKSLLREAMRGILPECVLNRKKSPYPKTHNPAFEKAVDAMLAEKMEKGCVLNELLTDTALHEMNEMENKTWFGQLMGRPQLKAWMLQLADWFGHYGVAAEL
jgi:asparagine synthase (glutamine-hydrolysing)